MDGSELKVIFISQSGVRVTKTFDSPYHCRRFVLKLKHSKTCKLVSYPLL